MVQVEGALLLRRIRQLAARGRRDETDAQLLRRFIADRHEGAFEQLVERHAVMVLSVCRNILHHQQDAEDACQAAFLVLARKAHTIRKRQAVSSWLHGVAFRVASRSLAQSRRRRDREKILAAPNSASPQDDLTVRELRAILHQELHRLPEKYRAPLLLCYWEGQTRDEAAAQLGTTPGIFKKRIERARNLLGSRLTRRGFAPSAGGFTILLLADSGARACRAPFFEISQSALNFAAGKSTAAAVTVTALAKGVIHTMNMTRAAILLATFVLCGTIGTGIGYQFVHSKEPVVAINDVSGNHVKDANDKASPAVTVGQSVEALKREIELAEEFRQRASKLLDEMQARHEEAQHQIRALSSDLDATGIKARITALAAERIRLDIEAIALNSKLQLIGNAKNADQDSEKLLMAMGEKGGNPATLAFYKEIFQTKLDLNQLQSGTITKELRVERDREANIESSMDTLTSIDQKRKWLQEQVARWEDRLEELKLQLARLKP